MKLKERRILRLGAASMIAVGLASPVGWQGLRVHASVSDEAAITQLVHDSQLAEQTLCVPPPGSVAPGSVSAVSPAVVDVVRANVAAVEGSYYTRNLTSSMTALLQRNCAASMTGGESIEVAGGVGPITCSQITVIGDQATASCQLVEWLRSLIRTGSGAIVADQPQALTLVHDELIRTVNGWRITQEEFAPAPGQGP